MLSHATKACYGYVHIHDGSAYMPQLFIVLSMLLAWSVHATAEPYLLQHASFGNKGDMPFKQASGLDYSEQGQKLYVTSSDHLYILDAETLSIERDLPLTGKNKIFDAAKASDVAHLSDHRVAIANSSDKTIAILDATLKLQTLLGQGEDKESRLSSPSYLSYSDQKRIYTTDENNHRISVFSTAGLFLYTFGDYDQDKKRALNKPFAIDTDAYENSYVLDRPKEGNRLSIYNPSGELQQQIGAKQLSKLFHTKRSVITAIASRPDGTLFLADANSGKIILFNPENMHPIETFGTVGKGRGQFKKVSHMRYNRKKNQLAVIDNRNHALELIQFSKPARPVEPHADIISFRETSVLKTECPISYLYDSRRELCIDTDNKRVLIRTYQHKKAIALKAPFKAPVRAAFDHNMLLILDKESVFVFSHDGQYQFTIGRKGRSQGEFQKPAGVALAKRIYVADTGNARVQVFSRNGVFLQTIGDGKDEKSALQEPVAITTDQQGDIYVADNGRHSIVVYSPQGKLRNEIKEAEDNPRFFEQVFDLSVDANNHLYALVQTPTNQRAVRVYKNDRPLFRFSPSYRQATTGMDKSWTTDAPHDSQGGLGDLAASLLSPLNKLGSSLSSLGSMFTSQSWIFNRIPNKESTIAMVDLKQGVRHTFYVSDIPQAPQIPRVGGDAEQLKLRWQAPARTFQGSYRLYGIDNHDQLQIVYEGKQQQISIARRATIGTRYRIALISHDGKHGYLSPIFTDYFQTGLSYYKTGKYQHALELFEQAAQEYPQHAANLEYLGKTLSMLGRTEDAMQAFEKLRHLKGHAAHGYHLQIQLHLQAHNWLAAKKVVDQSIQAHAADDVTYGYCADALTGLDDLLGAIDCTEKAAQLAPEKLIWQFNLAKLYQSMQEHQQAVEIMSKAMRNIHGKHAQQWLAAGKTYHAIQADEMAIKALDQALKIKPDLTEALVLQARLYLDKGDLVSARQLITRIASIPHLEAVAALIQGRIALMEGREMPARLYLHKATKLDPTLSEAWIYLAKASIAKHDYTSAKKALESAIRADNRSYEAHMAMGEVCLHEADATCAVTAFTHANSINQGYDPMLGLGRSLLLAKKYSQASQVADRLDQNHPADLKVLTLKADIALAMGQFSNGINILKQALKINPTNSDTHMHLAKAYFDNHLYDLAAASAKQAATLSPANTEPLLLLSSILLAQQMFDPAIEMMNKVVALDPTNPDYKQRIDAIYLMKKSAQENRGAAMLALSKPEFHHIFSAAYKRYIDHPVATVTLRNDSAMDVQNVKLNFYIKGLMDFPTSKNIPKIKAKSSVSVPLLATFNNSMLSIDEDMGVQTEVSAEYYFGGQPQVAKRQQTVTIYGKNAMVWHALEMVGAFVTPKDQLLNDFTRQTVNTYRHNKNVLNDKLGKAMVIFETLHAMGMKYLEDPNNPYSKLGDQQVDSVQFPRETLKVLSGDCDDLSILLSAALENIGIRTAILDVPGHLLLMFNTGVSASQKFRISSNDKLLAIVDNQVWVPLEATLIASTFSEAWSEGARKYHLYRKKGALKVMQLSHAWKQYHPVTLPPAPFHITLPSPEKVKPLIQREWELLTVQAVDRLLQPYKYMLASNPNDVETRMQIAIILARNGLLARASKELNAILNVDKHDTSAINNMGNIEFLRQHYAEAISWYQRAFKLAPDNAHIAMNISMAYYKQGDLHKASDFFKQAKRIDAKVSVQYKAFAMLLRE